MLNFENERHDYGLSKSYKSDLIALSVIFIVLFFFLFKSPAHPLGIKSCPGPDSDVFQTVAMVMKHGGRPYADIFDHKGPLMYLLNYLGYLITPVEGILYVEIFFLTVSFFFCYKIARLRLPPRRALVICALALSLLSKYYEGGNMTEEYALLFISMSLYFFLDYLKNRRVTRLRISICGACFACVCLLRANMIALWVVFCLSISGQCILNREFKPLARFAVFFAVGFVCVLLPCIAMMYMQGNIKDFFDQYILFNILYSNRHVHGWELRLQAFWVFFKRSLHAGAFLSSIFLFVKEREHWLIILIYLLCNLTLIALPGNNYGHYALIMIPAIIYPLSAVLDLCLNNRQNKLAAIVLLCVAVVSLRAIIMISRDVIKCFTNNRQTYYSTCVENVCAQVIKFSQLGDYISVYGNWCRVYLACNRLPATKYAYQFPIGKVSTAIMDEYFKSLAQELPPVIIVQEEHYDNRIRDFISKHNYRSVWTNGNTHSAYCAHIFAHTRGVQK